MTTRMADPWLLAMVISAIWLPKIAPSTAVTELNMLPPMSIDNGLTIASIAMPILKVAFDGFFTCPINL